MASTPIGTYRVAGVKLFVGNLSKKTYKLCNTTMSHLSVESLPEPGDRYVLGDVLGIGVWAKVVIVCYMGNFSLFLIEFSD